MRQLSLRSAGRFSGIAIGIIDMYSAVCDTCEAGLPISANTVRYYGASAPTNTRKCPKFCVPNVSIATLVAKLQAYIRTAGWATSSDSPAVSTSVSPQTAQSDIYRKYISGADVWRMRCQLYCRACGNSTRAQDQCIDEAHVLIFPRLMSIASLSPSVFIERLFPRRTPTVDEQISDLR